MSNAAQAYARTSQTTTSPRDIEAQALLKAARQLQEVQSNWKGPDSAMHNAVRQNIANIGVFVMKQTVDMQMNPDPAKLKSLIDINCNLAAGLAGRG